MSGGTVDDRERNKAVIRRLLAASDRGDLDAVAACYADDYYDHATAGSRSTPDKQGTLDTFAELLRAFPDVTHTMHELIAEDDRVVLRVSARATHAGAFRGIAPSGRTVVQTQTVIYRLRQGLIAERWLDGGASVADQLRPPTAAMTRVVRGATASWRRDVPGAEFWELGLAQLAFTAFRVQPHAHFAMHAHASEQITMVLEGQLAFDLGAERHLVGSGDAIAIPAWVEHAVTAGDTVVRAVDAWAPPPHHIGSS